MNRIILGTVALSSLLAAVPALAADWMASPGIRTSYPTNWENSEENPLKFEAGIRYWYSIGRQEHEITGLTSQTMETQTSSGELFGRVEDPYTQTYAEAFGGYGIAHAGTYSTDGGASLDLPAARLGYAGLDYGWLPFGTDVGGLGFVAGYQFTNDSPDTGRANFTTATSASDISWSPDTGVWSVGADSEINSFDIHSLKLGFAGKADLGGFDIQGEAAAIPYSWVSGTYGSLSPSPEGPFGGIGDGITRAVQSSAVSVNGHAYGASGKLMVGFHPTENLTIRIGGRASYLQGQYDATWDQAMITAPTANPDVEDPDNPGTFIPADPAYAAPTLSNQTYIRNNNPFEMVRYGALLEISGSF